MNRTITSFIAAFVAATIFIAAMAPAAFAQHPNDWANVQSVGIDEDLSITLKDGHKITGKFSSANDSELTIIRKGKQQVIQKDLVAQVYHLQRKAEKGKYAAIGAGIGAGVGVELAQPRRHTRAMTAESTQLWAWRLGQASEPSAVSCLAQGSASTC